MRNLIPRVASTSGLPRMRMLASMLEDPTGFFYRLKNREVNDKFITEVRNYPSSKNPGFSSSFEMTSCTNLDGVYIGDLPTTKYLCVDLDIAPEPATPGDAVCTIGWSELKQAWYGWSHRGMYSFYAGQEITPDMDLCWMEKYGAKSGRDSSYVIQNNEQAKEHAAYYAERVG